VSDSPIFCDSGSILQAMSEHIHIDILSSQLCREPVSQRLETQMVAMVRTPGSIEVGVKRGELSRFDYGGGDLILCRTKTEEWVRWSSAIEMLMVTVPDRSLRAVAEETGGGEPELQGTPHLADERVRVLMKALEMEKATGSLSGRLYVDSIGQALAAALMQARGVVRRTMRAYRGGLAPYRMRRVVEFMQEHLERDLTLQQIAEVAGLSTAYFSQLFRQSAGVSPHEYMLRARVERAQEMLKQPEMRVLDVAIACGFQTQQHFARVFREFCKVSPSEFRREALL
jgi:AraC family transcriptional regulator